MKKLKWLGKGYVPGVPAQDFDCEDDKLAAELVKGGGYAYAKPGKDADEKEDAT